MMGLVSVFAQLHVLIPTAIVYLTVGNAGNCEAYNNLYDANVAFQTARLDVSTLSEPRYGVS